MSWNVDKNNKFNDDMPLCDSCVHKNDCNDLGLLILAIGDAHEAFNHKGSLAIVECTGYENERNKWPSN